LNTTIFETLSRKNQYKFPYVFLGLYLTFLFATVCVSSVVVKVGPLLLPGGIFSFPLTFCICDIVGEVYGYAYPRLFIWIGVLGEFILSFFVITVSHLPHPQFYTHTLAYKTVFDPTIRYVISALVGLLVGELTNIYLLSKWKIILKGRFYIFRSLVSTALGQALLTIIVDILNFSGTMTDHKIGLIMIGSYLWKMGSAIIMVFPSWLLVKYLKKVEKVDHYDLHTNFNPFLFSLGDGMKERYSIKPAIG
jgi:uncharacterized integral membrane protein (TIGR00697 family)